MNGIDLVAASFPVPDLQPGGAMYYLFQALNQYKTLVAGTNIDSTHRAAQV